MYKKILTGIVLTNYFVIHVIALDCSKPPTAINPHYCCQEPEPSKEAEKCSKKTGFPLKTLTTNDHPEPPTTENIRTAACFAECVLNESKYITNNILNIQAIKNDLEQKFPTDSEYTTVMFNAFEKCGSIAQQKLKILFASPIAGNLMQGCNPLAGLLLGCVYMEYFENCPSSRWTSNQNCEEIREYIRECRQKF